MWEVLDHQSWQDPPVQLLLLVGAGNQGPGQGQSLGDLVSNSHACPTELVSF